MVYRHPKTKQAKSVAALDEAEGVKVRRKRTAQNLPSAWDDKMISSIGDRTWKRFRKLKWRRLFNL